MSSRSFICLYIMTGVSFYFLINYIFRLWNYDLGQILVLSFDQEITLQESMQNLIRAIKYYCFGKDTKFAYFYITLHFFSSLKCKGGGN